jgi:cytochrome c-type biogenesis protein
METAYLLGALSALWLGILTSISPCPMATNIAAISFIGRSVGSPARVLLAGLLYTLGRTAAYVGLGVLLVGGLLSVSALSAFLQGFMNRVLGPILILAGMFLLELITIPLPGGGWTQKLGEKAGRWGLAGAALIGLVFALAFCPVSAALFFGSLIPLALKAGSPVVLPSIYGAGTALPVAVFAVLIAVSARQVGKAFNRLSQVERWARLATGAAFILVGIYLSLVFIFRV